MKKQLRYALGEIFIVIVGISIAFSLNKCAEVKKNDAQKTQYLENLKEDIKVDKQHLEQNLEAISTQNKSPKRSYPVNKYRRS